MLLQPLIRFCASALAVLHADHATFTEYPVLRALGTVTCPYDLITGSFGCSGTHPPPDVTATEYFITLDEDVYCFWTYDVVMHCSAPATFYVKYDGSELLATGIAVAGSSNTTVYFGAITPCDTNMDGSLNVYDFMDFLNAPYDWNGDGSVTSADYSAILTACGGD